MRSLERTKVIGLLAALAIVVCSLAVLWNATSSSTSVALEPVTNTDRALADGDRAQRATEPPLQHESTTRTQHVDETASAESEPAISSPRATVADARGKITLQGVVRDAKTLKPIAGAALTLLGAGPKASVERTIATDAEGKYRLDGLIPGEHTLRASFDGYRSEDHRVLLVAEQPKSENNFLLRRAGLLEVTVFFPPTFDNPPRDEPNRFPPSSSNAPARREDQDMVQLSLVVSARPLGDTWSGTEGRVFATWGRASERASSVPHLRLPRETVQLPEPRPFVVSACFGRDVLASRLVGVDDESVFLQIQANRIQLPRADVRLTIIDAVSGAPIDHATAALTINSSWGQPMQSSDHDGIIRFEKLVCGPRHLTVIAHGYEQLSEAVTIGTGSPFDLGTRRLAPAAWISGRVVGADPDDGLNVRAFALEQLSSDPNAGYPMQSVVAADGSFRMDSVAHAKHVLRIESKKWGALPLVVDTSSGPVEDVALHGARCVDARFWFDAAPQEGMLRITDKEGVPVDESSVAEARAVIVRLVPGEYAWQLEIDGKKTQPQLLRVGTDGAEVQIAR